MGKLSPRDCVDLLFVREMYCSVESNVNWTHGGWLFRVFLLLLEMRDLNKLKSKLEIIMEKRMLDTCQHKKKCMFCSHCKNLLGDICNPFQYYCIASEISTNNYHDI